MPDTKIKSKDLLYEATLPPFLQRLHAQKAGRGGDADRHERPIARPKRMKTADEDDGPTFVDESGETISKEALEKWKSGANGEGDVDGAAEADGDEKSPGAVLPDDSETRRGGEQKVTDGTVITTKKRKVGKVVGEEEQEGDEQKVVGDEKSKPVKKTKKKAKPIRLAFDDDQEEGT